MPPRPSFGNPVAGFIRPFGSPADGTFRVTAPFGHLGGPHTTPHEGVDIGNQDCGEPVLAIGDGQVTMAKLKGKAKVIRIQHKPQFPRFESGYAHLATMEVEKDALVKRGDRIGTLGTTGADQCHLHLGMKLDGSEIDGWPLLEQNQETDMLKGTLVKRLHNARTTMTVNGTRFRPSPGTAEEPLTTYAVGTAFTPDFLVEGGLALGSNRWYGGWGITPRGTEFGYISEMVLNPLEPIEIGIPISDESSADESIAEDDAFAIDSELLGDDDI